MYNAYDYYLEMYKEFDSRVEIALNAEVAKTRVTKYAPVSYFYSLYIRGHVSL